MTNNLPDKFQTVRLDQDGFKLNTREREIALAMLMRSHTKETVQDIADRFQMSRDTIYKLIKASNGEFERFQAHIYDELFSDLYGKAVLVLHEVLETAPTSQKLKAIQMILQASGKLQHTTTLELKPLKDVTLEELQRETEVLEMEMELLEGDK